MGFRVTMETRLPLSQFRRGQFIFVPVCKGCRETLSIGHPSKAASRGA